ncbi:aldehyde dehydrogenase family protein [Actinoplanes couchii]|nr:aldehyde dehydrogenase family protein [Actinoplanes couchii]
MLTNPRTARHRSSFEIMGADRVTEVVAAARRATTGWAGLATADRSRRIWHLAAAIEDRADVFVAAEQAGTGKPRHEAEAEIAECIDLLRFYAGVVRGDLTPGSGHRLADRESWVRWEPLGVVAAIVPWNYPLLMAVWRCAPALAAGNTVVLKPAETTPDSVLLAAECAAEALGPGVLTVATGDRDTGRILVEAAVDAVAFTGSPVGGLDVASRGGLRRVSLELGGNCPAIVLPDAPDETYVSLARASTLNAGQSCAAPARVITLPDQYDTVVSRLGDAMRERRAGVDFGPLNNTDQAARFDAILDRSTAKIRHCGPTAVSPDESEGYWRPSIVLADLDPEDPAVREEVFGPVLTVQRAESLEDAVALANGVSQALAASVWGRDVGQIMRIARVLSAGEVWVNCHLEQTGDLPHGGRKQSGNGTDLSVLALAEYQRPKTITVNIS